MGINGRQQPNATWIAKLYWRSSCGRTLSPKTEKCHNCGDTRPSVTEPVVNELGAHSALLIERTP